MNPLRFLIADDDGVTLMVLRKTFTDMGHQVVAEADNLERYRRLVAGLTPLKGGDLLILRLGVAFLGLLGIVGFLWWANSKKVAAAPRDALGWAAAGCRHGADGRFREAVEAFDALEDELRELDPKNPILFARPEAVDPVISFAVRPKTRNDEDKLGSSLSRMIEEDPTLRFRKEAQTNEFILAGMGPILVGLIAASIVAAMPCRCASAYAVATMPSRKNLWRASSATMPPRSWVTTSASSPPNSSRKRAGILARPLASIEL